MPLATCTIRVKGRVQGVFFRASTVQEAEKLGLRGAVRNVPDGSVEVTATGERAVVERLLEWCRHGPPLARVASIDARWHDEPVEFEGFRVWG